MFSMVCMLSKTFVACPSRFGVKCSDRLRFGFSGGLWRDISQLIF